MNDRRAHCKAVLKWHEDIERAGTLVALCRKNGVQRQTPEEEFTTSHKQNQNLQKLLLSVILFLVS